MRGVASFFTGWLPSRAPAPLHLVRAHGRLASRMFTSISTEIFI